jgi:integrase
MTTPDQITAVISPVSIEASVPMGSSTGKPATLAEALEIAATNDLLPAPQLLQVQADLKLIVRATGQRLDQLPASPRKLRSILDDVLPRGAKVSAKRWLNVKSSLRRLLRAVGVHAPRGGGQPLPAESPWAEVLNRITPKSRRDAFAAFARWCAANAIEREQIDNDVITRYVDWRMSNTLCRHPAQLRSTLRCILNDLAAHDAGEEQRRLRAPRPASRVALPIEAFPASFQTDLREYLHRRLHADPFDTIQGRSIRPLTADGERILLVRAASVIAGHLGGPDKVTSLADLVEPERAKQVLLHFRERAGGKWVGIAGQMSNALIVVARLHVQVPPPIMAELEKLRCAIHKALAEQRRTTRGLTGRARQRVSAFDDPRVVQRLFALPHATYPQAASLAANTPVRAAELHERALALDLVLHHPIRLGNLTSLRLDCHFIRDRQGHIVQLYIPGTEIKNGQDFRGAIPASLAARIELHVRRFRPSLTGAEGPYLFAGRTGGARSTNCLGRNISALVAKGVGVKFNPHLVRHLAARMLLDADPNNAVVAQRVLGHASIKTTEVMYGALRNRSALNQWHEMVARTRRRSEPQGAKRRRVQP